MKYRSILRRAHVSLQFATDHGDDWRDDAACRGTRDHFPDDGDRMGQQHAKTICRKCPVMNKCLDYSMKNQEKYGVWGGVTERERHLILTGSPVNSEI